MSLIAEGAVGDRAGLELFADFAWPRLGWRVLHRPRLVRVLGGHDGCSVVVVAAPAGFGKLTEVVRWRLLGLDRRRTAWVRLRRGVDDCLVVSELVASALRTVGVRRGGEHGGHDFVVVVDRAEWLSEACQGWLLEFADAVAPRGQLVVCTRRALAVSTSRLEVSGRAVVVGRDELAFSEGEVDSMLALRGVSRGRAGVARVMDGCDGWPAAVAVACELVADEHVDARLDGGVCGGSPLWLRYVQEEVVSALTEREREVLGALAHQEMIDLEAVDGGVVGFAADAVRALADEAFLLAPDRGDESRYRMLRPLRAALAAHAASAGPAGLEHHARPQQLEVVHADESPDRDSLTRAERRILRLLASQLSESEIAAELYLSPNTVKTHRRNIYRKLGVASRKDAVQQARDANLLQG